jgi:CRP/FNR family transcriptional regulator, anaerobic regulatory protein
VTQVISMQLPNSPSFTAGSNVSQRPAGVPPCCRECTTRSHCLAAGLDATALETFEHQVVLRRHTLKRHSQLYARGAPFEMLFSVQHGQMKAERAMPDGRPQVIGFYQPGQLLGLESLAAHSHRCDAVALCDSTACAISYTGLTRMMKQYAALTRRFHQLLGAELDRQQTSMLMLGTAKAPQRLAAFLLDLAKDEDDAPSDTVALRMSRDDIASHLGLALESVSRQLTQFRAAGLLDVQNRRIELLDREALRAIAISS